MSRNLTLTAVFKNNRTTVRGLHDSRNADMVPMPIKFSQVVDCKRELIADLGNKSIRKVIASINVSGSNGEIKNLTKEFPSLNDVSLKRLRSIYLAMK